MVGRQTQAHRTHAPQADVTAREGVEVAERLHRDRLRSRGRLPAGRASRRGRSASADAANRGCGWRAPGPAHRSPSGSKVCRCRAGSRPAARRELGRHKWAGPPAPSAPSPRRARAACPGGGRAGAHRLGDDRADRQLSTVIDARRPRPRGARSPAEPGPDPPPGLGRSWQRRRPGPASPDPAQRCHRPHRGRTAVPDAGSVRPTTTSSMPETGPRPDEPQ